MPPFHRFPSPTPPPPYGAALSAFDGADPNGTYQLYVYDDVSPDPGRFSHGFRLDNTTVSQCADGQDNDGNGKVDLKDPGCSSPPGRL
jgi:hypothetical protein